jgi:hypothetical protein
VNFFYAGKSADEAQEFSKQVAWPIAKSCFKQFYHSKGVFIGFLRQCVEANKIKDCF